MGSLTRAGWALAVGVVAMVVAARLLGIAELYVLAATGAAALLVGVVLVRRPLPAMGVDRVVAPRRVHLGDQCRVELRVENPTTRSTPVLDLHDPVEGTSGARMVLAPMVPGESRTAGYRLPTERRGLLRVGPLDAVRTDPLGLAHRRHRLAGIAELTVLPAVEPLGGHVPGGGNDDPLAGAARPTSGRSGDEEFSTLRPYVLGDDLRRVHWASSARSDELLVRQDDPPWQGHLTIVLDARSDRIGPKGFEVAVSAAASVVSAVAERGDRTRLVVTDGTDTGPTDARAARDLLMEHLAVVELHPGAELPEPPHDGRSSTGDLVVITGTLDRDEVARLTHLRHRFAATRIVVVQGHDAFDAGSGSHQPAAPDGADLEVVLVRPGTSFATAWTSAHRFTGTHRLIGARR